MDCSLSADTKAIEIAYIRVKSLSDKLSSQGYEFRNFRNIPHTTISGTLKCPGDYFLDPL